MDKSTSILIIGSGAFGLSTAWYLAKAGYGNIRCLDRWPVPSPSSAGFDRNKIIRTEYSSPTYTKLAQEAIELWRDTLFKDVFHQTGWMFGTDGSIELGRKSNFIRCCRNTRMYGDGSGIVELPDWSAAVKQIPLLACDPKHYEDKANFQAIYDSNAGWVDPNKAMLVLMQECQRLGVTFISGSGGTVKKLLTAPDRKTVCGVRTEDGQETFAEKIVLATGSYSDTLLDFKSQLQAVAYVVTHVRVSEEQYQRYRHLPVLNISRRGYCFPPNVDRVFKICNTDSSYLDTVQHHDCDWGPISIPRDNAYHKTDTQPSEAEAITKTFLRYILPELGDAEIESSRMCWDMETHDYNWLIDYHPESPNSLLIATGGSGHSFKNIVNVGRYIVEALEGRLESGYKELWRWRPDRIGKDLDSEERARRPKLELRDAVGWKHD